MEKEKNIIVSLSLSLFMKIFKKVGKGGKLYFYFKNFQHICYEAPLSLVGCCTLDCNVEPPMY